MDRNQRHQALFKELSQEITLFIEGLSIASSQMDKLHLTAEKIGGPVYPDILKLQKDLKKVIEDAIRIKYEAREL